MKGIVNEEGRGRGKEERTSQENPSASMHSCAVDGTVKAQCTVDYISIYRMVYKEKLRLFFSPFSIFSVIA